MGFRFGFVSGFGAGYYLGARAGRQRYEQINRTLSKARRSTVVETAAEKARTLVDRDHNGDVPMTAGAAPLPVVAPTATPDVVHSDVLHTDHLHPGAMQADVVVTDVLATDVPDDYSSSR